MYAEVTTFNLAPAQATAGVPVSPSTAYAREADAGAYAVRDLVVDVDYEPVETTGDSLQYNRQHVSQLSPHPVTQAANDPDNDS